MAKRSEVILRAEVEDLGHAGDIVEVAPGYARNYLLPRGLAYVATEANKHRVARRRRSTRRSSSSCVPRPRCWPAGWRDWCSSSARWPGRKTSSTARSPSPTSPTGWKGRDSKSSAARSSSISRSNRWASSRCPAPPSSGDAVDSRARGAGRVESPRAAAAPSDAQRVRELAVAAAREAVDRKGSDVVLLDLRGSHRRPTGS